MEARAFLRPAIHAREWGKRPVSRTTQDNLRGELWASYLRKPENSRNRGDDRSA